MICADLHVCLRVFRCQRGLICSDLRGASQLQISAEQRAEKHLKRHIANHMIALDLRTANQRFVLELLQQINENT